MCCSFAERADWVADAASRMYGFMFVVGVGMVWDCVMEGMRGFMFEGFSCIVFLVHPCAILCRQWTFIQRTISTKAPAAPSHWPSASCPAFKFFSSCRAAAGNAPSKKPQTTHPNPPTTKPSSRNREHQRQDDCAPHACPCD